MYKIEFYTPESHLEVVKKAMFDAGAGKLENYDCCCWQTKGIGQFRALEGSNPFAGEVGKPEKDAEWKVEMVCEEDKISAAIEALKASHPYETPAYQYWEVKA